MSSKNVKYRKAKVRWSRENVGIAITLPSQAANGVYQGGNPIVSPITSQGTRTVGRFDITVPVSLAKSSSEIYWALVYVPQGTTPNALFATTGSPTGTLYEPNQYVLASGISDNGAGPIRIRSRIMRILHSGDQIVLILGATDTAENATSRALVSYNIKYN